MEKGRCEIYFFRGGYGGLSHVENNLANHCFLIKAETVKEFNSDAEQIVEKVIFQNKRAKETLKNAAPVYEWLAVSVDGFGARNLNPAPQIFFRRRRGGFYRPVYGKRNADGARKRGNSFKCHCGKQIYDRQNRGKLSKFIPPKISKTTARLFAFKTSGVCSQSRQICHFHSRVLAKNRGKFGAFDQTSSRRRKKLNRKITKIIHFCLLKNEFCVTNFKAIKSNLLIQSAKV